MDTEEIILNNLKALNNQVKKLNLEAQKYFNLLMEKESESKGE